jgi:two-component system sensor histidine kinase VicK
LDLSEQEVTVHADAERVRQILYNLFTNAIKYTPEGGHIMIATRRTQASGVVQVKNSGPGISEQQLEHLFELYYRTDKARQSQIRGTGLGLFIAKYLVEAQAGSIQVASQPGEGTEFTVQLPSFPGESF